MNLKTACSLLAFVSFIVAGKAVHWFITPHPDASEARMWAVGAQLIIALTTAVLAFRTVLRTPATKS